MRYPEEGEHSPPLPWNEDDQSVEDALRDVVISHRGEREPEADDGDKRFSDRAAGDQQDMETKGDVRARKLALNQSRFRSANERMERAARSHHFDATQRVPFLCECADPQCREIVMLSLVDYEAVRAHPDHFFLVAGHEDVEAAHERVLEAEEGYSVVEKVGTAGLEAERLDPRDRSGT